MTVQLNDTDTINQLWDAITSGMVGYATYAELVASGSTRPNGAMARVDSTDTGTHVDPVTSATVSNNGVFRKTSSGWTFFNQDMFTNLAQAWAESPTAPGGVGTKSAKSHALDAAGSASTALAAALTATTSAATQATSATNVAIGRGSKTLDVQTGKGFLVGQFVTIAKTAAPTTEWMYGMVTAYNSVSGSLTVDVENFRGTGSHTGWTVSLSGPTGMGNGMFVARWADFENIDVPIGTDFIIVGDTLGTPGGTASFRAKLDPEQTDRTARMDSIIAQAVSNGQVQADARADMALAQKFWRRRSRNGRWFVECEPIVTLAQFGCPGDGNLSSTNVLSGTNVTYNVQQFFNYIAFIKRSVGMGWGSHRVDALHAGWGDSFNSLEFVGSNQGYNGATLSFGGCAFIQNDWTQPLLSVGGCRLSQFTNTSWVGPYAKHMIDNLLGFEASAPGPVDSLEPRNWNAAFLPSTQNNRYNPHALVALDPRSGPRPTVPARVDGATYEYRALVHTGGNVYFCEVGGVAGTGTAPTGTTPLTYYTDGGVTWRWIGAYDAGIPHQWSSYPDIVLTGNRWCTGTAQYNRNSYSSGLTFSDCFFVGGVCGFVSKPGDNSLQGDFTRFERCQVVYCRFSETSCNHQARNQTYDGCDFALYHTCHSNAHFGQQSGAPGILSLNCSYGAGIYLFDLTGGYGGGSTFINAYCEAQARLGIYRPVNTGDFTIIFINGDLNFSRHPERGRCGRLLHYNTYPSGLTTSAAAGADKCVIFQGGVIAFDGAFTTYVDGVLLDQKVLIYDYDTGASNTTPWRAQLLQSSSGGWIPPSLNYWRHGEQRMRFPLHNAVTGAVVGHAPTCGPAYAWGGRTLTIPHCVRSVRAANSDVEEMLPVPHMSGSPSVIAIPSITATNGPNPCEITIVWPGANTDNHAARLGIGPGSIIIHNPSGIVFGVRSWDDATDTAILVPLDGFRTVGGVRSWINAPALANGESFILRRGALYTPDNPVFGDLTAGSGAVANVGNSAGVGTALATDLAVGDFLVTSTALDAVFGTTHTGKLSAVTNGSPGSLTLNLNVAAGKSATHRRLGFFRLPNPTNSAT